MRDKARDEELDEDKENVNDDNVQRVKSRAATNTSFKAPDIRMP